MDEDSVSVSKHSQKKQKKVSSGTLQKPEGQKSESRTQKQMDARTKLLLHGIHQPQGFPPLPSGWNSEWETFPSFDQQVQLFLIDHYRDLHAEKNLGHRALLVLHGMGEHGGRYLHVPHYVQRVVDHVYCLDHRGHGRSEGLRGHVERFDSLAEDVAHTVHRIQEKLKRRHGKAEIHLLGHSLGGHVALRTLFLFPDLQLASATASAPFLKIKQPVPLVKRAAARALSKSWGTLQLDTGILADKVSHDQHVIEAYLADRLVHSKMTPKFYTEMLDAMKDTARRRSGIRSPLLMTVPLADEIVDPDTSTEFFKNLEHREKKLVTLPDYYHEPLNEVGKDKVFDEIVSWMETYSPFVQKGA